MKKTTLLGVLLFVCTYTKAQTFTLKNQDFINFDTHEIQVDIDNFSYKGYYKAFKSKQDKKEYLIYSYFSRSVVLELSKTVKEIDSNTNDLKINYAVVIHNNDLQPLIKAISKKGIKNLDDFIIIHKSTKFNTPFINKNIIN
ncbi:hypothetical protein SAMN05444411_10995 [Lutibacter oricola]|uniref:Uncharacterized protein n=1 Tax=Lutibacter oricola TaxID=762486 RepID=A0A1H3EGK0_9FLAO|nr:hypothetical protein [Lutibacter oricola]SDX77740.1 hypothetical protein SAMN05444411_10995 [Lutibacter oricola]